MPARSGRTSLPTRRVSFPPDATEVRRDIATEAMRTLPSEARKDVAAEAVRSLRPEDREDMVRVLLPDQRVANRIWRIVVWAFAAVFVMSSAALIVAVFLGPEDIQLLLTVVTTVAGVLAGFISGRSSSGRT